MDIELPPFSPSYPNLVDFYYYLGKKRLIAWEKEGQIGKEKKRQKNQLVSCLAASMVFFARMVRHRHRPQCETFCRQKGLKTVQAQQKIESFQHCQLIGKWRRRTRCSVDSIWLALLPWREISCWDGRKAREC